MMRIALALLCATWLALLLAACSSPAPAPCESLGGDPRVICGFKNPEDIRSLPDSRTLLISEISALGRPSAGRLVFFDTQTQSITPAFPLAPIPSASNQPVDAAPVWGSAQCPGAPGAEFSPLGISVQQRLDGRWQVAAINHGGRMRVEMFELLAQGARYQLVWRGCVPVPAHMALNSVALLRNGGFVASQMFDRTAPALFGLSTSLLKAELGFDSGHVFEWLPTQPHLFRTLVDSSGPFPNGVALSADEATVFLALSSGHELRRLDRASGRRSGALRIQRPDNLVWDAQGQLLVASLTGSSGQSFQCTRQPDQPCGMAFEILQVDPHSLRAKLVFANEGSPLGGATVAQQLGNWLYLGSFTGDRILRIPYRP